MSGNGVGGGASGVEVGGIGAVALEGTVCEVTTVVGVDAGAVTIARIAVGVCAWFGSCPSSHDKLTPTKESPMAETTSIFRTTASIGCS